MAGVAAFAILATGLMAWEYALLVGDDIDAGWLVSLAIVVQGAGLNRLRKRDRRADFRWRSTLVLPDGVRPGLQARWSRAAVAVDTVAAAGFAGGGLLHVGAAVGAGSRWYGPIGSVIAGAATIVYAVIAFRRLRCSGYVVVTSQGVAHRDRFLPWAEIRSANRRKSGVYLRVSAPTEEPRYVEFSHTDCAVADERLTEVIRFYLANPHRRSALDAGPERLALPTRHAPASTPPQTAHRDGP